MDPAPDPTPAAPHLQFAYLDGIRGLAALAVSLFHTWLFIGLSGRTRGPPTGLTIHRAVELLGAGVHRPVRIRAHVAGGELPGLTFRGGIPGLSGSPGAPDLPPYFAALGLFLVLIAVVPVLGRPGTRWDDKIPVDAGTLLSHLFLVHNLQPEWAYKILDGPLWAIATEWQIYFVMALVLLPVWRFAGPWVAVSLAVLGGYMHPTSSSRTT